MVSDAPYGFRDSVLSPRTGVVAGVAGALGMLGLLNVVEPMSAVEPSAILRHIGVRVLAVCPESCGGLSPILVGFSAHIILGTIMGLLYAASQQRVPARGLVAVGIFYGFVLWVVSGLIVGPLLGENLRRAIRSWPWLLASLLYGSSLAAVALWVESHRAPEPSDVVQPD